MTAAELLRRNAAAKLLLGGGGNRRTGWSESGALLKWMPEWGIETNRVEMLPVLSNTYEEAQHVCNALARVRSEREGEREGDRERGSARKPRILLVTSACHMPRAEAVFRKAGMDVVPVACDFVGLSDLESKPLFNPIPRPGGFEKMQLYMHEVIGWWVYRWRGWV